LVEYSRAAASVYRSRQDRSRPAKLRVGGGLKADTDIYDSLQPSK
jgi:hypothetical protein